MERPKIAFNAQLDTIRVGLWGVMAPVAKAKGQSLCDLAAAINKMVEARR